MTPEGGIVMDDRIADMSPRNEEGNGDSPITVRTTMKPHVGSRMIAASVALGTAFALIAPSSALAGDATPAAASTGTTYYVSSTHGDDGNAGTDQNHPWKTLDKVNAIATDLKPGDSVLLERGSTFQDQYLHIKDTSGTADAPITIADYGDASAKPVIAANGVKGSRWYQNYRASVGNHQNKGTVSSAILLKDVSYITVKNLEITNDDPDVYDPIDTWKWTDTADSDGTKLDRSADRMDRTGVAGIAENGTTMSHVTLEGLNIHDVDGNIYNKHMANGGIYFMAHYARENKNAADNTWLQNHISRFDHITIKNNIVKDVDRWGIAVGYTAYLNFIDAAWGDGSIDDDLIAKYGQTNVTIENNYVKGAGGDAITLMYCDRPVIQYNVGDSVSKHMNNVDYPHDREHGGRYGGWVAAGIWPWRCKDPIFQYNEMYNNLNSEHGNGDGQAWDADYGDGTLYQYNYSYGNSFASLMICNQYAINTTFRYNISQNDRRGVFDLPSNGPGNHIYNNTVYIGKDSAVLTDRSNSQAKFENNIFINATVVVTYSDDTTDEATVTFNVEKSNAQKYNVLYPAVSGGAGVALKRTPKFTLKADSAAASIPAGTKFALGTGAPAGASVNAATGEVTLTSTQAGTITVPVTVTFSDTNESIEATATFTVTAPAALGTSKLETGTADGANVIYVPFTAKTPTTVADLLALVTAEPDSALKAVYRDGTKLEDAAAVKAGDVLRFYADGSTFTADYTVVQKNAWNWVDDFKTDSQGPIWTSQRQVSGKWQTITDFGSDVYPQTYYDKYYGVGVDYQNKSLPADRSAIHGLIADNPGDSAATAMAWTAPKAGSVKVTLDKVTGAHVEPYIRQSNSNGKDVVLKLLKNDEVICSATMTDSFATATGFNECLASAKGTVKVAVGDVLRFSVDAAAGASKSSIHISPVITYTDADEPSPEPGLSEQYAAAYPASVAAKVGEKATAAVSFTKGGAAADAPAGTTFAVAGDGFTVAADGTVSFTPTDAQAGKTVTATVTVTYSDKSTDTATVTFKVAAKDPEPEPTDPKADLRKEVESASKLDEKDYTADSWKVFAAALDNAKAVLEDKDATEAQISGALTTLKSATAALAKAGDTGKPDDGDKPSAGKPNDKGNGLSKTGASVAVIGVAMLLLAAAGFVTVNVVRRRR